MACPICRRNDIIYWGDSPCPRCQESYKALEKAGGIPKGVGIWEWGKARKKGEAAIAEGKTDDEALAVFDAELQDIAQKKREAGLCVAAEAAVRATVQQRTDRLFG